MGRARAPARPQVSAAAAAVAAAAAAAAPAATAAAQWPPLHCDISPTAFFLHVYFDVVRGATIALGPRPARLALDTARVGGHGGLGGVGGCGARSLRPGTASLRASTCWACARCGWMDGPWTPPRPCWGPSVASPTSSSPWITGAAWWMLPEAGAAAEDTAGGGLRQCLHNRLNATKVRSWLMLASDAARVGRVSRPVPVASAGDSAISTPEPLMAQVVCVGDAPLLEWLSQWRPSQIGSG
eukprot:COSAG01_NODE_8161_length_2895_cov_34.890558_3_plen_241_part_00